MTGKSMLKEKPISLSTRGFSHSGGARRIKASPTGRPDKPDQKEHTGRRRAHLVCMRGESQRAVNPTTTAPRPLNHHTEESSNKDALSEQHCCSWHRCSCVCFSSFRLKLHLSSCPALSASQWLLLCPGCQSSTSSGCRAAAES